MIASARWRSRAARSLSKFFSPICSSRWRRILRSSRSPHGDIALPQDFISLPERLVALAQIRVALGQSLIALALQFFPLSAPGKRRKAIAAGRMGLPTAQANNGAARRSHDNRHADHHHIRAYDDIAALSPIDSCHGGDPRAMPPIGPCMGYPMAVSRRCTPRSPPRRRDGSGMRFCRRPAASLRTRPVVGCLKMASKSGRKR